MIKISAVNILLSCLTIICAFPAAVNGQTAPAQATTRGKAFWFGFMETNPSPPTIQVYITSYKSTKGVFTVPRIGYVQNFTVSPANATVLTIPAAAAYNTGNEVIRNTGIFLSADDDVEVIAASNSTNSSDATVILPIQSITAGDEYFAGTTRGEKGLPSELMVVATEDNTQVEFTPSVTTLAGRPAGVPFSILLQKGQLTQIQAADSGDLSGTRVRVLNGCKKIAVFSGAKCSRVTYNSTCVGCDHLFEQVLPVSRWENEYLSIPLMENPGGTVLKVVASANNTGVSVDGVLKTVLNRGQFWESDLADTLVHCISTSKPAGVWQLMKSGGCNKNPANLGNPSLYRLFGNSQVAQRVKFYTNATARTNRHYVAILVKKQHLSLLRFNGLKPDTSLHFNVKRPACGGDWLLISGKITAGTQTISCDSGFISYSYGFGNDESYAFACGGTFENRRINFNMDNTVSCDGNGQFLFTATGDSLSNYRWRFSNGTDTSGNPVQRFFGAPGTYKIQMTADRNGAAMCDTVEKTVYVYPKLQFQLPFRDSQFCLGETVKISAPQLLKTSYQWNTGATGNIIFVNSAGKYFVTVTDSNGCKIRDSANVRYRDCNQGRLEVPNVFTPDKDGINDLFSINIEGYRWLTCEIYNRWGQKVATFRLPDNEGWNGKVNNNGADSPSGTYYFTVEAGFQEGKTATRTNGTITLLRESNP